MPHRLTCCILFGMCFAAAGCGSGYYPVRGTVTLSDGKPLSKGLVIFNPVDTKGAVSARGNIQPDGTFELSSAKPGDGVPVGKYKVIINPLDASDASDENKVLPFDIKYVNINTTDLEFEVKSQPNNFPIKLAAFRKQR